MINSIIVFIMAFAIGVCSGVTIMGLMVASAKDDVERGLK